LKLDGVQRVRPLGRQLSMLIAALASQCMVLFLIYFKAFTKFSAGLLMVFLQEDF